MKYYNDSQLIRKDKYNIILQDKVDTLEEKINDINKFKVLKLEKNDTLEKFVIVRDDRKKVFKYATIRGSFKNLKESLHELDLVDKNIVLRIIFSRAVNFNNNKIKE